MDIAAIGSAIITGNKVLVVSSGFVHRHICTTRSQANHSSWSDNAFDRAAVTLMGCCSPSDIGRSRRDSYPNIRGTVNSVRSIGAMSNLRVIIDGASPGDTYSLCQGALYREPDGQQTG